MLLGECAERFDGGCDLHGNSSFRLTSKLPAALSILFPISSK